VFESQPVEQKIKTIQQISFQRKFKLFYSFKRKPSHKSKSTATNSESVEMWAMEILKLEPFTPTAAPEL